MLTGSAVDCHLVLPLQHSMHVAICCVKALGACLFVMLRGWCALLQVAMRIERAAGHVDRMRAAIAPVCAAAPGALPAIERALRRAELAA